MSFRTASRLLVIYLVLVVAVLLAAALITSGTARQVLTGTLLGAVVAGIAPLIAALLGADAADKDRTERRKSEASLHALEITKLDYELKQRMAAVLGRPLTVLAPAKAYREIYKGVLDLQSDGSWPKSVEESGLLYVILVGPDGSVELVDGAPSTVDSAQPGGPES